MEKNFELFSKEIEEIREFSDLNKTAFGKILTATRTLLAESNCEVDPVTILDVIENATSIYTFENRNNHQITSTEAVVLAANVCGIQAFNDMIQESNITNASEFGTPYEGFSVDAQKKM